MESNENFQAYTGYDNQDDYYDEQSYNQGYDQYQQQYSDQMPAEMNYQQPGMNQPSYDIYGTSKFSIAFTRVFRSATACSRSNPSNERELCASKSLSRAAEGGLKEREIKETSTKSIP